MPIGVVSVTEPLSTRTVLKTKKITPKKLKATPPAFFKVIGSFKTMAAMNIVKIGVNGVRMLVSKGVVMVLAFRNDSCVMNNPSIEARKIFGKSRFSTFSFGRKSDTSQKRAAAPMARKHNKPIGETSARVDKSLQMIMLKPKIE